MPEFQSRFENVNLKSAERLVPLCYEPEFFPEAATNQNQELPVLVSFRVFHRRVCGGTGLADNTCGYALSFSFAPLVLRIPALSDDALQSGHPGISYGEVGGLLPWQPAASNLLLHHYEPPCTKPTRNVCAPTHVAISSQ